MSHQLINHNCDLLKLKEDGYEVEIVNGYLVIHNIPYVTTNLEVKRGVLVSALELSGEKTLVPRCHIAHFAGELPCDAQGQHLNKVINCPQKQSISSTLETQVMFSSKPKGGYTDYYHKMSTYVSLLEQHATNLRADVTARTGRVVASREANSPFRYTDSATVRAGTWEATSKLDDQKIAVIGLGGTGSYILDNLTKTPVQAIHIYDEDLFHQHNAFRAPGAPSIETLAKQMAKVEYFGEIYGRMHRNIVGHRYKIDSSNVSELAHMDFVFLAIDNNNSRRQIIEYLISANVPFIDVGMGLQLIQGSVIGSVRTTTFTEQISADTSVLKRIPGTDNDQENAYSSNIQVADLNMFNAALAVMRWKKYFGFYLDLEKEHQTTFAIDGNHLLNEDQAA